MLYTQENGWKDLDRQQRQDIIDFCEPYKEFLDKGKTEREFILESLKLAEEKGFEDALAKAELNPGDKVWFNLRDKNLVLAVIGEEPLANGADFVVSHVDSPRLDLKQKPLYEDSEFALLKTHYYGGVKKYQWASRPLALHGVVILKSGAKVNITIGEDDNDPVFVIPDLLPHLDHKVQRERKASEVLKGSEMHVLVGSIPCEFNNEEIKDEVKYNVLQKLNYMYDMTEDDFISAEFELVPAAKARDIGLDRGLVGSYGHDDRICAWTSVKAITDMNHTPKRTAICFLVDKEEIGSNGSTGLQSRYIEHFMEELAVRIPSSKHDRHAVRRSFWNSRALSSDVNAGLNPLFKQVHDQQNVSKLGYGIVLTKYTGARGKAGSNDADAEFIGELRAMFDAENIKWQTGMLGEVDEGGGGTVAMLLAQYGIRTIDAGAALLSMHSPMEVASKYDIHEIYKAYKVFFS